MKKSASILVLFLFLSCISYSQQVQKGKNINPPTEIFSVFQSRFFTDSIFQFTRINFPLEYRRPDAQPRNVNSGDWKFLDHLYWTKSDPPVYHQVYMQTVPKGDFMRVDGQLDNRYYEYYYFSLIDGKWYLVKYEIPGL